MAWSGGIIILGEGSDTTRVVLGTLLGEEPKVTAARGFEFTVGHGCFCFVMRELCGRLSKL